MQRQSSPELYGIAELGRFGLGHRLLAWARCLIWCQESGAAMLAPSWMRVPLGPWIRRERDKRLYFLFFRSGEYVAGIQRLRILLTAKRIDPSQPYAATSGGPALAIFRNAVGGDLDRFFPTFRPHHELLLRDLTRMTRPRFVPAPSAFPNIAIHVRRGDFATAGIEQLRAGVRSARLPLQWYVEMLDGIREMSGADVPAVLYSDGTDEELRPLLVMPSVARAPDAPAITHLLSMAYAKLLIGTGSGMSLWASLLGQVPRICFPGQRLVSTLLEQSCEPECEFRTQIPQLIVNRLGERLA